MGFNSAFKGLKETVHEDEVGFMWLGTEKHFQVVYSEREVGAVITGINVEGKITAQHHHQQEEWHECSFLTSMKAPRRDKIHK